MPTIVITYKKPFKRKPRHPKRGVLPDDRRDEIFGRPKKKKFITFYDMGLKFTGSTFGDVLTTTVDPVYDFTDPASHAFWKSTAIPTLADLDALRAEVIDYTPADIDNLKHRQIGFEEGEQLYNLWLGSSTNKASTDVRWAGEGWGVTQAELNAISNFTIGADDLNVSAVLTGAGKNHITTVYDSSESAVAFTPKPGDKYFLMPQLSIPASVGLYRDDGSNHFTVAVTTQIYPINTYNFSVTPRVPLLTDSSPYFLMSLHPPDWQGASGLDSRYPAIYLLTQFMETYGVNNDRREAVLILSSWSMHDDAHYVGAGYPPAPQFPSDGSIPTDLLYNSVWRLSAEIVPGLSGGNQAFTGISGSGWVMPTGALLAVIKQGSTIYYVWK